MLYLPSYHTTAIREGKVNNELTGYFLDLVSVKNELLVDPIPQPATSVGEIRNLGGLNL